MYIFYETSLTKKYGKKLKTHKVRHNKQLVYTTLQNLTI